VVEWRKMTHGARQKKAKRPDALKQSEIARQRCSRLKREYEALKEQVKRGMVRMRLDTLIKVLNRYPESEVVLRVQEAVASGKARITSVQENP